MPTNYSMHQTIRATEDNLFNSGTKRRDYPNDIVGDFSHTLFAVAFLQNLVNRLSGQILVDEREKNTDN